MIKKKSHRWVLSLQQINDDTNQPAEWPEPGKHSICAGFSAEDKYTSIILGLCDSIDDIRELLGKIKEVEKINWHKNI